VDGGSRLHSSSLTGANVWYSEIRRSQIEGTGKPVMHSSKRFMEGDHVFLYHATVTDSTVLDNVKIGTIDLKYGNAVKITSSKIMDNACLDGYSIVESSHISGNTRIRSALVSDCSLSGNATIEGAFLGDKYTSVSGVTLSEGYLGDGADVRGPKDINQVHKDGRVYTKYRTGGNRLFPRYAYSYQEFNRAKGEPVGGVIPEGSIEHGRVKGLF
jgi:NDP-sugar pyrophosphorylase family protein